MIIAGVDEAGSWRGPWWRPRAFSRWVFFQLGLRPNGIKDSKKSSQNKRQKLQLYIQKNAYGIGWASPTCIDAINIRNATFVAMHLALEELRTKGSRPDLLWIDGPQFKPY